LISRKAAKSLLLFLLCASAPWREFLPRTGNGLQAAPYAINDFFQTVKNFGRFAAKKGKKKKCTR